MCPLPCLPELVTADWITQVVTFSKEKMKNKKSGILAFECSEDNYEPLVVHFWERYDGNRSMGLHNTTDEYSNFMNRVSTQTLSRAAHLIDLIKAICRVICGMAAMRSFTAIEQSTVHGRCEYRGNVFGMYAGAAAS